MRLTLATRYIPISTSYNGNAKPGKREFAKELRIKQTTAEKMLWQEVKGRGFDGYKFRRQHGILGWIVDFYCSSEMLVVELDGEYHEHTSVKDKRRDAVMSEYGFTVLRMDNEDVLENMDKVKDAMRDAISQRRKKFGLLEAPELHRNQRVMGPPSYY